MSRALKTATDIHPTIQHKFLSGEQKMYPSHKPPSIPHLFQVGAHSEFGQVMYCWIMEIMQIHIEKRVLINILADLGIFSQFSLKFWEYDKFSKYCRVAYH